jgi:hypothetical protein
MLLEELKPLYQELHTYVRRQLRQLYGEEKFPQTGHIPAHILGNKHNLSDRHIPAHILGNNHNLSDRHIPAHILGNSHNLSDRHIPAHILGNIQCRVICQWNLVDILVPRGV